MSVSATRGGRLASSLRWVLILLLGLTGLGLFAGGAQLALLGGSLYYLLVGPALVASAVLLYRRSSWGAVCFMAVLLVTLVWSVAEVGFAGWQLMPRILGPAVIGILLATPYVRSGIRTGPNLSGALLAVVPVLVLGVWVATLAQDPAEGSGRARSAPVQGTDPSAREWQQFGGTFAAQKFTASDQINRDNVAGLKVAWQYQTGDTLRPHEPAQISAAFEATPIKVGDGLYACTPHNVVIALDPDTGREKWRHDPQTNTKGSVHLACRGVTYYPGKGSKAFCDQRLFVGTVDDRLISLDLATGRSCAGFGAAGEVRLDRNLGPLLPGYHFTTSPPAIVGDAVIIGSFVLDNQSNDEPSGVVRAYHAVTGELLWGWDVASPKGIKGTPPGGVYTRNTPNVWSVMSADPALGLVYLPTGNTPPDFFGGKRTAAQDRYSSSIVALDVRTGDVRWNFQTVHHDIWDYDIGAQPTLVDVTVKGTRVPAMIVATKWGELFMLDRRDGKPIIPVAERPVPQGAAPGEWLSPTQPFSVGWPSFTPPDLREADMWGASPIDQLWCRVTYRSHNYAGLFTPQSERGSIIYPSSFGTIDWGGVAVDPERQIMIVNTSRLPYLDKLIPRPEVDRMGVRPAGEPDKNAKPAKMHYAVFPQAGTPYGVETIPFFSPLGLPCHRPPWGEIAAVDLKTNKLLWKRPLGTTRDHAPLGMPLPVGVFNLGGSVVTRGGVAFIAATIDNYLRAFDVETGQPLWQSRLPAGGQANPMSYVSEKTGRQYVVIAAGGHASMRTKRGDFIVAYALDRK